MCACKRWTLYAAHRAPNDGSWTRHAQLMAVREAFVQNLRNTYFAQWPSLRTSKNFIALDARVLEQC